MTCPIGARPASISNRLAPPGHWSPPARIRQRGAILAGLLPLVAALAVAFSMHRASAFAEETGNTPAGDSAAAQFFESQVRPLLANRCFKCHGPEQQKGGLRLDSHAAMLAGGDTGPAIIPGDPDGSLLIDAVRYGQDYQMPPAGKLPDREIQALSAWIKSGARWPDQQPATSPTNALPQKASADRPFTEEEKSFWAFQPPRESPATAVRRHDWPHSPLDDFILAGLEKAGLSPAGPADRRTLIRRATFDLTGLPPSPDEVAAFLADQSPDAFARVVDRLLDSPRYGQRWARHWLDVARYADSNGMDENLAFANAFRYRDYVIDAFNADKPFDQFICQQIAGDLLPAADESVAIENRIATGFLVIGPKMLAEDDPIKMEMDIVDEQVDTVGQAFLGLTLGCARCHDHKFDPITMADYYGLAGIFKSTKTMENFSVVARWQEQPVATAALLAEVAGAKQSIADQKEQLSQVIADANDALIRAISTSLAEYLLAARELDVAQKAVARLQTPVPDEGRSPTAISIEAEKFVRGNVLIDTSNYGQGIGVVYNKGELPNQVEYEFDLPAASACQIEIRYAAAESRPVRLSLNGCTVHESAAAAVTGSWFPDAQRWEIQGVFPCDAGKNTIRLHRDGPFPHFDKLVILPREAAAGQPAPHVALTPAEIAAAHNVNQSVLSRLSATWANAKPGSLFALWQQAAALGDEFSELPAHQSGQSALARILLCEPTPRTLRQLANRYQQLFAVLSTPTFDRSLLAAGDPQVAAVCGALVDIARASLLPADPEKAYPQQASTRVAELRASIGRLEAELPAIPEAMTVSDRQPQNLRIHIRGSHWTLGDEVARRFPRILAGDAQTPLPSKRSGRLELARWIASPDNPLTARVMANRIWQWHFGQGLVRSPDNFGRLGQPPTNQPLLDWLACRFVQSGWSMKSLHRLIMLSSTYQMSTRNDPAAAQTDPENKLHYRFDRRRMDAEELRDSILAISGRLDAATGGSLLTTANRAYVTGTSSVNATTYTSRRRSIYLPVVRSAVYEMFQAFDFADPSVLAGQRATTTVAPQALFMLNSPLVAEETSHLAQTLLAQSSLEDRARVELLYQKLYNRPPTPSQTDTALDFLGRAEATWQGASADNPRLRAWQSLCRGLLSANEFIYIE